MDLRNGEKSDQSDYELLKMTQNKANILSGITIPMFCNLFWDATSGDKELVRSLCGTMSVMYQKGLHKEALAILHILFELLEMELSEDILLLSENQQDLDKFLLEMQLDLDDTFGELIIENQNVGV